MWYNTTMTSFYTYAYLRTDRTPYYIGKGKGRRAYQRHDNVKTPDPQRILILKDNLTEDEAYRHEVYMIDILGRKDNGTGILRNKTAGGDAPPVFTGHTEESRRRISESLRGRTPTNTHTPKILKERSITYKARGVKPPLYTSTFSFVSPDNIIHTGENIREFAKLHDLNPNALYDMRRGKQQQHKGWTLCLTTQ